MFFIATAILQRLFAYTSKIGINTDDLLKEANVDRSILSNPDNKLPLEYYYAVLDAAIEMTGDPFFGLHMGESADVGDLSIVGYIMASCRNVGEAFEKAGQYFGIIGSVLNIYWRVEEDSAKFIYDMRKHFPNNCIKHCVDTGLSNFYNMIKSIARDPVDIKEVWVKAERPEDTSEYKRIFKCPILFKKDIAALVFPPDVPNIPLRHPNPALLGLLEHHANSFLSKIDENDYYSRKISLLLFGQIQGANPSIEDVARDLGMSVRVLQKKLKEEGATFSEIATNVRQELAKSYLAEKRYSIDDITYLLGFSEPSVFRRAFKAWTGITPGHYRSSSESTFKPNAANS
ncbi:MAG: AraC family transcriptional regulator [Deltaproteobacteria bacterium]|nr:AraC family transcriptional regulator [Deltaproteobacteria bacterium]